jgi:predicted transposase/invertase (TIGR01784 family)
MRKTLDPKNDVVFKILFAAPAHRPVLIALLTAVLKPTSPIRAASVLNPEIPKVLPGDRSVVLDIRVQLDDGRLVDVEMQVRVRKGASERFLYYWAKVYGNQLEPADPFTSLKPCVSVLFLGEPLLPGTRFHSTFRVRETHDHQDLTDRLELHIIELSKLVYADPDDVLTAWGRFFAAQSDEELEVLAMTVPELKPAKVALDEISSDEKARQAALDRELNDAAHRIYVGAAYHSGKAAEAVLMLERLLAQKFGPLPDAAKARLQKASIKDLERWFERGLTADSLDAVFGA